MRLAEEKDKGRILEYLRRGLQDCVYLYIDIMNYGIATENMKVWFAEETGRISLVVMKYYDSFQIYSESDNYDVSAVKELLEQYPVAMVSGKKTMIEQLAAVCPRYESTYGVVFVMDKYRKMNPPVEIIRATERDAQEIAELICSDDEIGGHYTVDNLTAQLEERIRTKTGRSYIIRQDGRIVAHSATYAEAEGIAVVGGTIISEKYRDTQFYMLLSNYMVQELVAEEKRVYTFALSAKMIRYHKLLHLQCGDYGKMIKRRIAMKEKIINVLEEFNEEIVEDMERDLLAFGIMDSFDIVKLVVELETAMEITIDVDMITPENFRTATEIVRLVEEILAS